MDKTGVQTHRSMMKAFAQCHSTGRATMDTRMATVVVIGTFDTKEAEFEFI
jgi:hypothetical protein